MWLRWTSRQKRCAEIGSKRGGKTNGKRITDDCVQGDGGTRHSRMGSFHSKCGVKVSQRGGVRRMAVVSGRIDGRTKSLWSNAEDVVPG